MARFDLFGNEMRDDLGIGLALEFAAATGQRLAQRLEIIDDAIVDKRDLAGRVGVRVARRRRAVRCPARVRDTAIARGRVEPKFTDQIGELAIGAAEDRADAPTPRSAGRTAGKK